MLNRHLNTIFDKHIESKNCTNSAIHYVHIILAIVITTNLHLQVTKFYIYADNQASHENYEQFLKVSATLLFKL